MMQQSKVLDIDEFLQTNSVVVRLGGKEYVVRDVPVEIQKELTKEEVDMVGVVAKLLGAPREEVEKYGVVALSQIVRFVQENLLGPVVASPEGQ